MVMPRAPMFPPTRIRPWDMALAAPLPALPCTTISAPAFNQPTSSETGPRTSITVWGNPMDPTRCPGCPVTRMETVSCPARQRRPPMPCWP